MAELGQRSSAHRNDVLYTTLTSILHQHKHLQDFLASGSVENFKSQRRDEMSQNETEEPKPIPSFLPFSPCVIPPSLLSGHQHASSGEPQSLKLGPASLPLQDPKGRLPLQP